MKQLVLYIFCCSFTPANAQNSENTAYLPIITNNQTWIGETRGPAAAETFQYTYSADSVWQEGEYCFERINSVNEDGSEPFVSGYFKETNGKLVEKLEGSLNERVVLEMSLMVGDTFQLSNEANNKLVVVNAETISYRDNIPRKRLELQCTDNPSFYGSFYWVEGIW